jgi:hypothetical protein
MDATSKQRKENHVKLFTNMAETGDCKEVIFKKVFGLEKFGLEIPPFFCFACEEVKQDNKLINTEKCKNCPIDWGTFEQEDDDPPCCREGSPYLPINEDWFIIDSDVNRKAAKNILDLPFRKSWKEDPEFLFRGRPVKVGDILFDTRKGLNLVVSIGGSEGYPIWCEDYSFTSMGFNTTKDKFPSLFWPDEIQNFPSIFSQKKKVKKSNTVYINKYKRSIHAYDTLELANKHADLNNRLGPAVSFTYEWEE